MSLAVILAAVWLIGIPLAILTIAAILTEFVDRRGRARELDECLDRILSGGRTRSPRERRRRMR